MLESVLGIPWILVTPLGIGGKTDIVWTVEEKVVYGWGRGEGVNKLQRGGRWAGKRDGATKRDEATEKGAAEGEVGGRKIARRGAKRVTGEEGQEEVGQDKGPDDNKGSWGNREEGSAQDLLVAQDGQ